jgi:phage shock protein PspC (stress-responsive transcriptional regulator)
MPWSWSGSVRVGSGFFPIVPTFPARKAGAMNTTTENSAPSGPGTNPEPNIQPRASTLSRSTQDRMIAGVASGIGRHLGVDVLLVRIAFVVLALAGGLGVPLYLACWLLIPEEGRTESIAGDFASDVQTWRN